MNRIFLLLLLTGTTLYSQSERVPGAIIKDYGWTYKVPNVDIATNTTDTFKVLFDLSSAPEDPAQLSKWITTVARFMNMHVDAGKPASQLDIAAVFHGNASYSLLKDQYYKEEFGVSNPNLKLIKALQEAGVDIILCGQTAAHRNLSESRRISDVQLALSTMTAMVQMQQQGYTIINFN